MRLLCVIAFGFFFSFGNALSAEKTLKTDDGERYSGKVLMVDRGVVFLRSKDGKINWIAVDSLDKASLAAVDGWAKSQGGDLTYASWMKTPDSGFSKMWPSIIYGQSSVHLVTRRDLSKDGIFVHESQHFRFVTDADLEMDVLKAFAARCESTREFCKALPFNLAVNYYEGGYKCDIHIYKRHSNYISAGGVGGSTVSYNGQYNRTLLYLKFDAKDDAEAFTRSISLSIWSVVQQMLGPNDYGSWFEEGLGLYVATTPYANGQYRISRDKKQLVEMVKTIYLAEPSKEIIPENEVVLPKLRQLVGSEFGNRSPRYQAAALLMVDYFCRVDSQGRAEGVRKYVKAIQKGERVREAAGLLLGGRPYDVVEKEMVKYYALQGLEVSFSSSVQN